MSGEQPRVFTVINGEEIRRLDSIDLDQLDEIRDPQAIADWWAARRRMWAEEDAT
jgi:hypothetical protein